MIQKRHSWRFLFVQGYEKMTQHLFTCTKHLSFYVKFYSFLIIKYKLNKEACINFHV
jgi:hypothetical protein